MLMLMLMLIIMIKIFRSGGHIGHASPEKFQREGGRLWTSFVKEKAEVGWWGLHLCTTLPTCPGVGEDELRLAPKLPRASPSARVLGHPQPGSEVTVLYTYSV